MQLKCTPTTTDGTTQRKSTDATQKGVAFVVHLQGNASTQNAFNQLQLALFFTMEKLNNNATTIVANNDNGDNAIHFNKFNFVISKDAKRQDKANNYKIKNFFNSIDIIDDDDKTTNTLASFMQKLTLSNEQIKQASSFANSICNDITTIYTKDKDGKQVLICDLFTCKKCLASAIFDARHGKSKNIFEKSFSWYAICKLYVNALHQQKDNHDKKQLAKAIARQEQRNAKARKQAKKTQTKAN